jgi:hypothetical protein
MMCDHETTGGSVTFPAEDILRPEKFSIKTPKIFSGLKLQAF